MCVIAAETVLLAFQNYILMLGSSAFIPALLVPAMGGTDVSPPYNISWYVSMFNARANLYITLICVQKGDKARVMQTLLFVAGIKTLVQSLFGTRLPAVVGGSFAYVIPIAYIINDSSLQKISNDHEVKKKKRRRPNENMPHKIIW